MFYLDACVEWKSQSLGHQTTKKGYIIEIVYPGEYPQKYRCSGGPMGGPRKKISYIVRVGKTRTYWPRTKWIKLAEKEVKPHRIIKTYVEPDHEAILQSRKEMKEREQRIRDDHPDLLLQRKEITCYGLEYLLEGL